MIADITCLALSICIVAWQYSRNFERGLLTAIFLMVVLPESVGIQLVPALPTFTFHRLAILYTLYQWYRNPKIDKRLRGAPFYQILALGVGCFFISTLLSSFPLVSFKRFLYYTFEFFLLFCIIQTSVSENALARRIVAVLGYGLLTVAILGIIERYWGIRIMDILPEDRGGYGVDKFSWASGEGGDIIVSYRHRILFGVACAIGALKFLIDAAFSDAKRASRRNLLYAFVCGASLYFSMSRGPWLAFLVGSVVLFMGAPKRLAKPASIMAGLTIIVLVLRPGVWATISGLEQSTLDPDSVKGSSFRWRLLIMNFALSQIDSSDPAHFLFGYGGGSTIMTEWGKTQISAGEYLELASWDCEDAIVLYERGVVGLLLAAILFGGMLIRSFLFIRRHEAEDPTLMAFVCGTMAVFFFMMINVAIYALQLVYIEAIVLGIGSRLLMQPEPKPNPELALASDAA